MAKVTDPEEVAVKAEKKRLDAEKKALKKEQKAQKKEAKRRAREIARQEEALDEEDSGGIATFFATLLIVVLWIAVICVVIKLDVGGFGSSVMTPLLKDVPVVNKILPGKVSDTETEEEDIYGGYTDLKDAVDRIAQLELELERAKTSNSTKDEEITTLKAEVVRLQEFEKKQVEFQRIRTEFYEEVVYADKGPGAEEYRKFYEEMDPSTAEYLYKQVVAQSEESKEIQDFANTYAQMKPKQAAKVFEEMSDMNIAARILMTINVESRAKILDNMDSEIAAKLTKIMNPES